MRSGSPLAGWAFLLSLLTARSVCRQPIMGPRSDDAAGDGRRGFAGRDARGPAPSLLGSPGAVGSGWGVTSAGVQVMGASGSVDGEWFLPSAPGASWVLVAGGSALATFMSHPGSGGDSELTREIESHVWFTQVRPGDPCGGGPVVAGARLGSDRRVGGRERWRRGRVVGHQGGGLAVLGGAGRDRRGRLCWGDERGTLRDRLVEEPERTTAPGERDPRDGVSFFAAVQLDRRLS